MMRRRSSVSSARSAPRRRGLMEAAGLPGTSAPAARETPVERSIRSRSHPSARSRAASTAPNATAWGTRLDATTRGRIGTISASRRSTTGLRRSNERLMPPPTTTSSGSSTATSAAMSQTNRAPNSWIAALATGSPSRSAAKMSTAPPASFDRRQHDRRSRGRHPSGAGQQTRLAWAYAVDRDREPRDAAGGGVGAGMHRAVHDDPNPNSPCRRREQQPSRPRACPRRSSARAARWSSWRITTSEWSASRSCEPSRRPSHTWCCEARTTTPFGVNDRRHADADADEGPRRNASGVHQLRDGCSQVAWQIGLDVGSGQHRLCKRPTVQVGEHEPCGFIAHIDPCDRTDGCVEAEQGCRSADLAGSRNPPRRCTAEVGHDAVDGHCSQTGLPTDSRLRRHAGQTDG